MHGRREADAHRAHSALGERQRRALVEDPAARPRERFGRVALGGDLARLYPGDTRGDGERPVAAAERLAERLDRCLISGDGRVEVAGEGDVVAEGQVNDGVGRFGALPQHVDVLDIAAQDLCAGGGDLLSGGVRARQAENPVSLGEELGNDGRPDPTRRSGDKYAHDENLLGRVRRPPVAPTA